MREINNYDDKIIPLDIIVQDNFPFIAQDFDSLTLYEKYCKIVDCLNQVIEKSNLTSDKVSELNTLVNDIENYINNYFDNLDVQEEINNKLDQMASSGELGEIISEYLSINKTQMLLGLTFKAEGMGEATEKDIIVSLDGINWGNMKINAPWGRDPSIVYDNKRKLFYITCTPDTQTEYTFIIYVTSDLINYTPHKIVIPNYLNNLKWAPDLYYDETNDKLIVSFSYQYGTENDVNGDTINAFDIIIAETNDFTNFTMTNVHTANLINKKNRNHIDSNIIFYNNFYYLCVSDQYYKILEIYSSTNLSDFNLVCQNILNTNDYTDNTIYLEGGSQYIFNDEIFLMSDSYAHLHTLVCGKTTDFMNYELATTNLNKFRHGSIININDEHLRQVVQNIPNLNFSSNNKLTPDKKYYTGIYIPRNTNREVSVIPNSIIFIEGNSTITNLRNPFNCENQKFCFITNPNETLTIQKIMNNNKNKIYRNSNYNNEKIFTINLNDNSLLFPLETYEDIENITVDDFTFNEDYVLNPVVDCYRTGNIIFLRIQFNLAQQLDSNTWVNVLFNITNTKWRPRFNQQLINNLNNDMQLYTNGNASGSLRGTQNTSIIINTFYLTN